MKRPIAVLVLLLAAGAVSAQPPRDWDDYNGPSRRGAAPNLNGTWFMAGHEDSPCRIIMRSDGRAEFINEHGDHAWGRVRGNQVVIPDWTWGDGNRPLWGTVRGDRIVWPDGNFWSRRPYPPPDFDDYYGG
ncbi:MAG: hypothetical protein JO112_04615 [Planctomycetes bacterium]|nr:hypothetical protein [Planctomycetota bacterium]